MKSILISIKPKYVAKILNGEKTIEIRKTMPKCELPIDVYIYCTKENKQRLYPVSLLDKSNQVFKQAYREDKIDNRTNYLNGKVVAKFTLDKVELIRPIALGSFLITSTLEHKEILDKSCLTENEIRRYLTNMYGYAWHISNLEIFDKPKELSEFKIIKTYICKNCPPKYQYGVCLKDCKETLSLTKAPQSFAYVEVEG